MTDLTGNSFSPFTGARLPVNVSSMAEPELAHWAEQKTVGGNPDTPLVRIGAFIFWAVVAALVLARIFLIAPDKLRPATPAAGSASSAFHLTTNVKL